MRLDDDFDFEEDNEEDNYLNIVKKSNQSVMMMAVICISILIFLILFLVLRMNTNPSKIAEVSQNTALQETIKDMEEQHAVQSEMEHSLEELISGSSLTADDLDIWDTSEELQTFRQEKEQEEMISENEAASEDITAEETDPSKDGLHTLIIHTDGKEEWVDINPYLARNTYQESGLVCQDSVMKYYENNRKISKLGAVISKQQDYVDFNALKKAGVEYVMIRLGQRGYQSGELTLDEYFADNMQRAAAAGLDIGVYFFSQATTLEEAEEEADFVIAALENYELQYPVAFYMDYVQRETTRGESTEKMVRTNIAIRFMDKMKEAGYMSMLAGTKEWLIQKYSLGSMMGYDFWLWQDADVPDYPYEFIMWQYTEEGSISGISGDASLCISFVDFSLR